MRKASTIAIVLILALTLAIRFIHIDFKKEQPLQVTTWDALGYYLYLPATFIYGDITQLEWFPEPDARYGLSGGGLYQARRQEDGAYVLKYLAGIAIMQAPFFFLGHAIALISPYPADGFSLPYQFSIATGMIIYLLLSLLLLARVLSRYFDEITVAFTLFLVFLASNAIQYIAVEAGMSHGYILFLYAALIYTTLRWHETPKWHWAALTAFIIGLGVISRPTEIVMIFIPLLWDTQDKQSSKRKWQLVRDNRVQLAGMLAAGLLAVTPQLIYWKIATGHLFHTIGSRWDFLAPHWQVLAGWEKGWFIYTPVTLFFIAGIFFSRRRNFFWPLLVTGLMSVWIVIAWHDWRYGGSYSARALVQVYPLFALPLAALISRVLRSRMSIMVPLLGSWLVFVNIFQVWQYNRMIIHYDDMNRRYYAAVFLDPNPSPADMSLLDGNRVPRHIDEYSDTLIWELRKPFPLRAQSGQNSLIHSIDLQGNTCEWIRIDADIPVREGIWESWLKASLLTESGDTLEYRTRLHSPISLYQGNTHYSLFIPVDEIPLSVLTLSLDNKHNFGGVIRDLRISLRK